MTTRRATREPGARDGAAGAGESAGEPGFRRWARTGVRWGQIYWYTLESTNPAYDVMEKKSLEDWSLEKSFKGVQGVVGCIELRRADEGVPDTA